MIRPMIAFIRIFVLVLALAAPAAAQTLPAPGDMLPALPLAAPALAQDAATLGVVGKAPFGLADIDAQLILLEVIGVYCAECAIQVPLFNNLHKRLKRAKLLGRVQMVGLAAGGTPMEVAQLRNGNKYVYPVLQDERYEVHKLLGEPKTPFTMLVTPQGKVLWAKLGVDKDMDALYALIKKLLEDNG